MSAAPHGSCTVAMSGGRSQPVAQGETRRAIHPEGEIRKASPMARAACGAARNGVRTRLARRGLEERFRVDSAGTGSWHVGEPPDPRAREVARRNGIADPEEPKTALGVALDSLRPALDERVVIDCAEVGRERLEVEV